MIYVMVSECSKGRGLRGSPMEGIFVEVDKGGVLTHGKRQSCAYCRYSNLPAQLYRLISLSFLPFRVCSKKQTLIRLCNLSLPGPVGIWCQNDVVSTRCDVIKPHQR